MLTGILLLAIVVFGILVLFGQRDAGQFYKFVIFLIIAPVLLAVGINHVLWFWYSLPYWIQILGFVLMPFLLLFTLRSLFSKSPVVRAITDVLWDATVFAFTFPFRLLYRSVKLISLRERNRTRLSPHPQSVVGRRPPLVQQKRSGGGFDDED